MTYEEILDALDGLSAYDSGALDSGIHDEALRERVKTFLKSLQKDERRVLLGRVMRDLFLTDEKLASGYGAEDAADFGRWLDEEMDVLA